MNEEAIISGIISQLQFTPTPSQDKAITQLSKFFLSKHENEIFILKGYAGTGKTHLISSIVRFFETNYISTHLLAPTGRAAKVFSSYSGKEATTIHRKIYWGSTNDSNESRIQRNTSTNTIFFVDEASMISTDSQNDLFGGQSNLLDDLISYIFSNDNCKLVLIGDTAQLPPIGVAESKALNPEYLKQYSHRISECTLNEVVRQEKISYIIENATILRKSINNQKTNKFPKLQAFSTADVKSIKGDELIEEINKSYDHFGIDDTMIITRSNKRANIFNNGVRAQILYREEELTAGDYLMVTKNNYFWSKEIKELPFIANGDLMKIIKVRKHEEMYGFRFVNVTVSLIDNLDLEIDVKIILESLQSDTPSLSKDKQIQLEQNILEDYQEIETASGKWRKMKENPFFNALQVKYGYAVTCHKAQGGQWSSVFVDQGYVTPETIDLEYYKWLYTAITRAQKQLFLVNFSDDFFKKK